MQALSDVVLGALAPGVNLPTLVALNLALLLTIACLGILALASINRRPALVLHLGVMLFLALGLCVLVNWFVSNVGLVDVEDSRKGALLSTGEAQAEDEAEEAEEEEGKLEGEQQGDHIKGMEQAVKSAQGHDQIAQHTQQRHRSRGRTLGGGVKDHSS